MVYVKVAANICLFMKYWIRLHDVYLCSFDISDSSSKSLQISKLVWQVCIMALLEQFGIEKWKMWCTHLLKTYLSKRFKHYLLETINVCIQARIIPDKKSIKILIWECLDFFYISWIYCICSVYYPVILFVNSAEYARKFCHFWW